MSHHPTLITLLGALALGACSSGPGEPPNLPAPEYEAPRSYDPDKAIDSMEGSDQEAVPDAPPPPEPAATPDTPPEASAPPEGAGGGTATGEGGGAAEVEPEG